MRLPLAVRRGLVRVWIAASALWAIAVMADRGWYSFTERVISSEIAVTKWRPIWGEFRFYVDWCADFTQCLRDAPNGEVSIEGDPSRAMVVARVLNAITLALFPPTLLLAAKLAGWVISGFRPNSN